MSERYLVPGETIAESITTKDKGLGIRNSKLMSLGIGILITSIQLPALYLTGTKTKVNSGL